MNCLNCVTRLTSDQIMYCSLDCMRDYANKRRNFGNRYSRQIKAYNLEFQERMYQIEQNERYLGRY